MAIAITFDTLAFAKRLKSSGFTEQQAEALAEVQGEIIEERLATKQDLEALRLALQRDMKDMESRLTIRLGKMLAWSTGITILTLGVLIKLL